MNETPPRKHACGCRVSEDNGNFYVDREECKFPTVLEEFRRLAREAACPCCKNGVNLEGETCQECHGKALAIVAYETVRVKNKLAGEALQLISDGIVELTAILEQFVKENTDAV